MNEPSDQYAILAKAITDIANGDIGGRDPITTARSDYLNGIIEVDELEHRIATHLENKEGKGEGQQ